MPEEIIGKITHVFPKISVAVVSLSAALKKGDKLKLEGEEDQFEQEVTSMQVEHKEIEKAKAGQEIGLKTDKPVKKGSDVFKL